MALGRMADRERRRRSALFRAHVFMKVRSLIDQCQPVRGT
jgi:hypothetical protein